MCVSRHERGKGGRIKRDSAKIVVDSTDPGFALGVLVFRLRLLEGRQPTLRHVPADLRFELVNPDSQSIAMRKAWSVSGAACRDVFA